MSAAARPTASPLICLRAVDSSSFTFTAFDYTVLTDTYIYVRTEPVTAVNVPVVR
jgi:hypothetical protein